MSDALFFAIIAFLGDLYASARYFISVRTGRTRPHIFSWIIWAMTAGLAAAASYAGGAILTGVLLTVASLIDVVIVLTSLRHGTYYITRADYLAFTGALATIPLWLITKEPLLVALCASGIGILGEIPTLRKAWALPYEENGEMFFLFALISLGRLMATEPLSWTTALYPGVGFLVQVTIVCIIFRRRHAVPELAMN